MIHVTCIFLTYLLQVGMTMDQSGSVLGLMQVLEWVIKVWSEIELVVFVYRFG